MRKFPLLLVVLFFVACNNKKIKISERDRSITVENAYNDLFLDSSDIAAYISQNSLPDSIANKIISFYNSRNYEYAWFASDGVSEQAMGFYSLLSLDADTSAAEKKLEKTMDDLLGSDGVKITASNKTMVQNELFLTESLINYTVDNYERKFAKKKEVERFIPIKKVGYMEYAESLLNKKDKDAGYFAEVSKPYKALLDQLKKYVEIDKSKQWMTISGNANSFKKGGAKEQIAALKKNLVLLGDMAPDSSLAMDVNVENGIKNFQTRMGFTADGIVSDNVLAQMKVSPEDRVKQILINMNRMRWMPQEPDGNLIMVNLPAFNLTMLDGKKEVFSMPVVVGKDGHNTIIFSDMLTTIVFSPYWNIPESIVKSEIVPGMNKNANYIANHDMEITGEEGGFPIVRQKPGPENSLGKVKFLFPNSFNIYFHDTPAKSLFDKDVRAYSHGCIRLGDPEKLANYLLRNDSKWSPDKIKEAMNKGEEQYVKIKDPVPVFITYYTAWADENGKINFRNDIYDHDKKVASRMFANK